MVWSTSDCRLGPRVVWALEIPGRLTGIELTEGCGGEDKREEDQDEYEEPHHCWQIRENNRLEKERNSCWAL